MAVDPKVRQRQIDEVARIASDPVMLEALGVVSGASPDGRMRVARKLASRDALAERGLNVPTDFRIALRQFEDPAAVSRGSR